MAGQRSMEQRGGGNSGTADSFDTRNADWICQCIVVANGVFAIANCAFGTGQTSSSACDIGTGEHFHKNVCLLRVDRFIDSRLIIIDGSHRGGE